MAESQWLMDIQETGLQVHIIAILKEHYCNDQVPACSESPMEGIKCTGSKCEQKKYQR